MSRYVQRAASAAPEDRRVQPRVAGVEDGVGPLCAAEIGHGLLVARVDGDRRHPRVVMAFDGRAGAGRVQVGHDHALEERAAAGDGGDGRADAAGAEDEDAHGPGP